MALSPFLPHSCFVLETNKQTNKELSQFPEMSTFRSIEKSWTVSRHQSPFLPPTPMINNTNNITSFNHKDCYSFRYFCPVGAWSSALTKVWFPSSELCLHLYCVICPPFPSPNSQQVERIAGKQQLHKKKETHMFMLFQKFVSSCGFPRFGTEILFSSVITNLFPCASVPNLLFFLQ